MDTIGIIVPCFNEEDVLELFYKEMHKIMDQMSSVRFRIMFVDDGSRDNTLGILRQLHSIDPRCEYVSFSRNFGKESALYAGFQNLDADYTVLMDADLQHPPALIPKMYEMVSSGQCDCAAAFRKDREGESKIRAFLSRRFYGVMNNMSSVEMRPNATDFRMMNRKVCDAMRNLTEHHRFTKGIFSWVGFHTEWIPYENIERAAGESKWHLKSLLSYALNGITSYSDWTLKLPKYVGIIFILGWIASIIVLRLLHHAFTMPDAVFSLILFCSGILCFMLRGLGVYIYRIYEEDMNRPQYLVKEKGITDGKPEE
ncbi:MAG: glycosyltransferase [Lachnospiraceae bacterium]|uniref:Glycosyltransferase family 2 protein n=1 Tax=Candidatus Weimeria bifida TaxID=2599074 RepID=A0A6N7IY81_9FIRM|nr:glycosyltransferase family 2 protein [Candidatus Weimeria bifida]RRF96741.1 MAG: glycosyltransferase [Lachnospiraceae bacterium]